MEELDFDLYDVPTPKGYAETPVANGTLALLYGNQQGNFQEVAQQTATMGPAYVASERAKLARADNLLLLKEATLSLAKQGNAPAVTQALTELNAVKIDEPTTFHDDVSVSAEAEIERIMATTGLPRQEIINKAKIYSDNATTRTVFEVAVQGLNERSKPMQLAQDVLGVTTAVDWSRLSPVVNEELEKLGFTGDRAVTFATSVSNFVETLRIISPEDRGKVVNNISNKLVSVVGEENAKRFFESAMSTIGSDAEVEAIFGLLDVFTVAAVIKGGVKAAMRGSKAVSLARKIGSDNTVAIDLANKIVDDSSILGATAADAADAAITAKTLVPKEVDGLSASIQKDLSRRVEATLADLNSSLYTGGANIDEIMASKIRLERLYSTESNPTIIRSSVNVDTTSNKLSIDVLYGDSLGKPFATAEDALNYHKPWLRGNVEVVPMRGTDSEIATAARVADESVSSALATINEAPYKPKLSTVNTVGEIQDKSPLFSYGRSFSVGEKYVVSARAITQTKIPLVKDVWADIRANASSLEQFVIDRVLKTLPAETKVIIRNSNGRAHYSSGSDTVVMYRGNKDSNVFSHELIHAVTTNKISYGKVNPSSAIGKIVTDMDNLRLEVLKNANKVNDPQLLNDIKYLTKDLYEFSTSGLWSINQLPKVAVYLNSIKYKNTTLLSKLWSTFKELLGFGDKDTALAEWFGLNEKLTREGLTVQLPSVLRVGESTFVAKNIIRKYPNKPSVVINKEVDDAFKQLEDGIADKISLDETAKDASMGFYVRQRNDMSVFSGDIGKISQSELDSTFNLLGKVNPRLGTAGSIYTPALTSMYKKTKYGKAFAEFITKSFDKLDKTQIDKVNDALVATEKLKRDMTVFELGEKGVISEVEQEAYYSFRTMRNMQWYYKEKEVANALTSMGYRNVFVGLDDLGQFSGPAKQVELNTLIRQNVYDVENNKVITITEDNVKELSTRGLQVFEYAKAQEVLGRKGAITKVAVLPNSVRVGDITSAVGRVDGAYSRVYNEEYFIKISGTQLIDDVVTDSKYAFRTAASEADAAKYVNGLNNLLDLRKGAVVIKATDVEKALGRFEKDHAQFAIDMNAGKFDGSKATFNYTRLDDNFFRDVTGVGTDDITGGKVFWSNRSEDGLRSITTGSTDLDIKGPLESLSAEISNTSRYAGMNEWRRTSIQRWYNTFEDIISPSDKLNTKTAEDVFFNVTNNVKGYALGDTKTIQMLANRNFIVNQLGVKTVDEQIIQHTINNLTSNINVPGFSHVGKVLRSTDLVGWMKGVNSTLMLGLFSPAQLIVQANGMLNAITISPLHGAKAAFSIRPILVALTSDSADVAKWVHNHADVLKSTGMKADEFNRVAAAIKRVGLLDNIGASSIYNAQDGALNIFSRRKAKFNQAQMMFFNTGEEITRVGSFDIARREFIQANPDAVWDTSESLNKIMQRADDLSMNMSQVNEARITKGVFGIPLQFLQHNIRLGTNLIAAGGALIGKKSQTLSTKEAFNLTLGSYLLYGINNNATPDFIEDALGNKLNGVLTPAQKQYFTQGILAGLLSTIGELTTGKQLNIALGARLSSIQWYEDLYDSITELFKGEKVDLAKLAGPTGSTLIAAMQLPVIFTDYLSQDEVTLAEFGRAVSQAGASLSSSWRNVDKAYWAYKANGMVINKKGDPQANLSWPELVAQGLGFTSTEQFESNTVFKTNKDYAATMKRYADSIMRHDGYARKAFLAGDIDGMNRNYLYASSVLIPLPLADQAFIKRLIKKDKSYDTAGREAFNKWATEMSSHKNRLLVTSPYGE